VEVRSRRQEPRWRNFAGRRTYLPNQNPADVPAYTLEASGDAASTAAKFTDGGAEVRNAAVRKLVDVVQQGRESAES